MITRATEPTVLVVDDEVDICANMADILGDLGFRVDMAHDGDTALEMIRSKAYDIALLDLKMPGMDGLELYRRIKHLRSGTVAIIVTAYANTVMADQALASGAWRIVAKPVDSRILLDLVEKAIGQPLILVVDDDREMCANLWDILRDRGYRVDLAHDLDEGIRLLESTTFQVVLMDVRLPGGDCSQLLNWIRAASPGTQTILITAHRSETDRLVAQILEDGADAICYKPFDVAQLLKLIGDESRKQATNTDEESELAV
jgi:DNA-binding response OmpR family regulator